MEYIIIGALELGFIYSIMALGVYISFRILNIPDLTIDGSFTLGCAVSSMCGVNGFSVYGIPAAILAGSLAGMVTGLLITKLRVQPILSGILTMTALYSINLHITQGLPNVSIEEQNSIFYFVESFTFGKLFLSLIILLLVAGVLYVLLNTRLGMCLRATGDNEIMAQSSSIHAQRMKVFGLSCANALVALSGGLLAQYQLFADISSGSGMMVIALASIICGEALIRTHRILLSIIRVIIGTILYRFLITMAFMAGLDPNDLKLFSALLIILVISLPSLNISLWKRGHAHA